MYSPVALMTVTKTKTQWCRLLQIVHSQQLLIFAFSLHGRWCSQKKTSSLTLLVWSHWFQQIDRHCHTSSREHKSPSSSDYCPHVKLEAVPMCDLFNSLLINPSALCRCHKILGTPWNWGSGVPNFIIIFWLTSNCTIYTQLAFNCYQAGH